METKIISKSGSLKGYKLKVWLKRNKETIKNLCIAGVGVAIFFLPQIRDPGMSAAAASISAIITKLVADTLDFWISDVEIIFPVDPPIVDPKPPNYTNP